MYNYIIAIFTVRVFSVVLYRGRSIKMSAYRHGVRVAHETVSTPPLFDF